MLTTRTWSNWTIFSGATATGIAQAEADAMAEDKKFPDPPPGMLPMFIQMKSAWTPVPGRALERAPL